MPTNQLAQADGSVESPQIDQRGELVTFDLAGGLDIRLVVA